MLTLIEGNVNFYEDRSMQNQRMSWKEKPRERGVNLRIADLPSCNVDSDEDEDVPSDNPERDKPLSRSELKSRVEKNLASHRRRRFQPNQGNENATATATPSHRRVAPEERLKDDRTTTAHRGLSVTVQTPVSSKLSATQIPNTVPKKSPRVEAKCSGVHSISGGRCGLQGHGEENDEIFTDNECY